MSAYIADTETNTLEGYPIEIAYVPCAFVDGLVSVDGSKIYDEYFSCPEPISYAAMAVHHILEEDIAGKPSYDTFKDLQDCEYLIGHNVDYDLKVLQICNKEFKPKPICTLALSRMAWPHADAHNISALIYMLSEGSAAARERIRNAHNAKVDICLTATILKKSVKSWLFEICHLYIKCLKSLEFPKLLHSESIKAQPLMNYQMIIFDGYYVKMILIHILKKPCVKPANKDIQF